MPELPEVEALRLGLLKCIVGSTVKKVVVLNAKIVSSSGTKRQKDENKKLEFEKVFLNKKIKSLARRAKNIIIEFETSEIILVHLKMTGQMIFEEKSNSENLRVHPLGRLRSRKLEEVDFSKNKKHPNKHAYIIFELDNGSLYYNDIRQFGYVLYFKNIEELNDTKHFDKLGLEPFDQDFTLAYFKEGILKKNTSIKKVLLDQSVVVGCGNIYADEACHAAHILPMRYCKSLKDTEIKNLYKNIISILEKAIHSGGSSIANYLLADGERGSYADYHKVYKRENKNCLKKVGDKNCEGILQKITFASRGTHFCSECQK